MTQKEREHFNRMRSTLKRIAGDYMTIKQLKTNSEKIYGLSPGEALEMAYENIKAEAKEATRGVKAV